MPPMNPGAYGPVPGMMGAVPTPGASVYPPEFSYGLPQGYGQQAGLASYGASAVANVPSAVSTVGMMAGLGTMFSASPALQAMSFLDPTTAGLQMGAARFTAARAAGMGMGGALGAGAMGAAAPMAIGLGMYAGASYTGQQFLAGAREQQQLGSQLSGLGFANPMAASGRGFGSGQLRQVGAMMRELDSHDPFTTMSELNKSMDQFMGMGMHKGVQDAREFGKKFKEFTNSIHDMAKELGTTMEEAGRIFGSMRQSGFYSSADVMGNSRSMQAARGMGMDEDTFLGMQNRAAGVTRSALVSGRAGARTSSRFAQDLMIGASSRQSGGLGLFSGEDLMDMTGAGTSSEAAAAMGTQFTGLMTGFLRNTAGGRGFLASLGKQRGGSFTGEIDEAQLAKFAGGNVGLSQLAGIGQGKMGTAQSRASFTNNEHKITSSLMESERGVEGVMRAIDEEAKKHFRGSVADDDAMVLFIEKVIGADKQMAEKVRDVYKNYRATQETRMRRMREEQAASLMQLEMRRNYTFEGLKTQVTGGVSDLFAPVRQGGADFNVFMQETGQSMTDSVMGIDRAPMGASARSGSIARLMNGRATGIVATDTGVGDFESGTAGHNMAVTGSFFEGKAGVKKALGLQQRLAAGGTLSLNDLGLSSESKTTLDQFLASNEGQQARGAIMKAKQARALGDSGEAEAHMERARHLVEGGFYKNVPASQRSAMGGLTDRYMAAVALQSGDASLAREIAGKGEVRSHAFGDVKKAREDAVGALKDAGVESALADQLAGGGAGSELFIQMTSKKPGNAEWLSGLAASPRVAAMLSDVSPESDEYFEVLAGEASKQLGGSFSSDDVRAVMSAETQARKFRSQFHKGGQATGVRDQLAKKFTGAGMFVQDSVDTRTALSTIRSAGSQLGSASEEIKSALGSKYSKALAGLRSVGAGERFGKADKMRLSRELDGLLEEADYAGVSGMAGGSELGLLAEKRKKALGLAGSGDLQGIASQYGLSGTDSELTDQIRGMGIAGVDTTNGLDSGELEEVVKNLASQDLISSLSAGEGGGIFLRGMTQEQQVAFDLQRTAGAVQKLTEAVDAFHTKVFNPDEKVQKPAGK